MLNPTGKPSRHFGRRIAGAPDRQALRPEHGGQLACGLDAPAVDRNGDVIAGPEQRSSISLLHHSVDQVGAAQEIGDEAIHRPVVNLYW